MVFLHSLRRLLVTASVVPSSPILVTVMIKSLSSSETSAVTRATRPNITEDTILQRNCWLVGIIAQVVLTPWAMCTATELNALGNAFNIPAVYS
jgi:hypothetical protein